MFDMFTNLMLDTITDLIVVLLLVARIGRLLQVKIAARSLLFGRSYGGCRRADFGSALFRVDAPQPPRDPGDSGATARPAVSHCGPLQPAWTSGIPAARRQMVSRSGVAAVGGSLHPFPGRKRRCRVKRQERPDKKRRT